jgi:murein DD-endopeptidase MepM/ murein hydrolase activator NlpD
LVAELLGFRGAADTDPIVLKYVALVVLTAGVCAGCGSRPDAQPRAQLPLPRAMARDIALAADTTMVSAKVTAGATLASILRTNEVVATDIAALVERVASVFDLRKVRAQQPYVLVKTAEGFVRRLEYEIDDDRVLRVARTEPNPAAELIVDVLPIPKTKRVEVVRGTIDASHSSLVAAVDAAGETIDLTLALAEIFGGDIDFSTEVQPGDQFELSVEKEFREDQQFAGYGPILAAEFVNEGRRIRAVRFTPEGGSPGYYDERGVSMKRFFLASPLKFEPVVTSGFSRHRLHPVLRQVRAHLGVDYRAPAGAPVVAVADGAVVSAGYSGGGGRVVHLRHANGFETKYLHLSSIAVRAGARVQQGEIVGRVGSSGLATGPHLDYRLLKNGAFINPITAHRAMPPADPVPAGEIAAFESVRDSAFAALATAAVATAASPDGER